jgi:nicotinate-nucleotide pyrophosphorylase (carboxylating)
VDLWFQEDCPSFDYGGFVVGEANETATLYGKSRVNFNFNLI